MGIERVERQESETGVDCFALDAVARVEVLAQRVAALVRGGLRHGFERFGGFFGVAVARRLSEHVGDLRPRSDRNVIAQLEINTDEKPL